MNTLCQFAAKPETIPTTTAWYLADLGEARGRQELFTKQSPQRLRVLREHALIESAVSSNRIEGVVVAQARVGTLVFGRSKLRDRNEEELRGYRNALTLVHEDGAALLSPKSRCEMHRLSRGEIGDAGRYKTTDSDIIERYPDGRERVRFRTVEAAGVAPAMAELLALWGRCREGRWVHPLIALAAFNLDFLLQCYHLGYDVGRYISFERLIEQNKERYYETLEQSSHRWHEARNDPWPYVNYVLFILKNAYREFEERVGQTKSPRGTKTELVESAVGAFSRDFTLADLERACSGVSRDMVRRVLRNLQQAKRVECIGRGPGAVWRNKGRNKGSTSKRG